MRIAPAVIVLLLASPALAAPEVVLSGNERTRDRYLAHLAEDCTGGSACPGVDSEQVSQCLLDSRLFSEVQSSCDGGTLHVEVEERWSLIPVPFVRSANEDLEGGVYLMESNLFGAGKTLVVGGTVSTSGYQYLALYKDPSIALTHFTFGLLAGRFQETKRLYDGRERLASFGETDLILAPKLGYRLTRTLTLEAAVDLVDRVYEDEDGEAAPEALRTLALGARVVWKDLRYRYFFDQGVKMVLDARRQVLRIDEAETDGEEATRLRIRGKVQYNLIADHALQLRLDGAWTSTDDLRDAHRSGLYAPFRGIPKQGAWTRMHAAASLDYQIPLAQWDFGTLAFAPFVDAGWLRLAGDEERDTSIVTYGGGLYVYVKKISFPGVGLEIGQNRPFDELFASLSVGFGGGP